MRHINGITKVISLTISEFHQKLSCQIVFDTHILEQNICIETKVRGLFYDVPTILWGLIWREPDKLMDNYFLKGPNSIIKIISIPI